jgi:hypothetical protein
LSARSYSAGLFVAIVWAAAFFMLNRREAAPACARDPQAQVTGRRLGVSR